MLLRINYLASPTVQTFAEAFAIIIINNIYLLLSYTVVVVYRRMPRQNFHFTFLKVEIPPQFRMFVFVKKVTVHINGPIVAEASAEFARMMGVVSLATVKQEVEAVPDATDIEVLVHSPGGSVFEGWAIHNYLRSLKKPIVSRIVGECYSIATVPFLAGDKREIAENGSLGIHNPFLDPENMGPMEADDLIKLGQEIKDEEVKMLNFYVERTGADKAEIESLMKQDTRLTAEQAKQLGFATEIAKAYDTQSRVRSSKILAYVKNSPMSTKPKTPKTPTPAPTAAEKLVNDLKGLVGDITKALKPSHDPQAKSFNVSTTDGETVNIEAAGDMPANGDMVNKDGQPYADASFTVAEGGELAGYTCKTGADGKITEVTEPAASEDSEEVAALKAENEVLKKGLTDLAAEVKKIKAGMKSGNTPPAPKTPPSSRNNQQPVDDENPFKAASDRKLNGQKK